MFKVLAQSLRLGQPPDATSALRVLVEAIEKQSAEIDDLRAKLAIASSRMQYAEARLGRILEASEPDLARDDSPPSSIHQADRAHPVHAPAAPPPNEPGRGSQRPPPMPAPNPQPAQTTSQRSPSVRPPAIPHALPIPQAPGLPQGLSQGLTNPHPPLNIPQPMPLPSPGGAPQPTLAQQSVILQQMAQPPLMPQGPGAAGPSSSAQPDIPRAPGVPVMAQNPKLPNLVDDGGFDEFNQTLVINKRDVLQVAREAPFPMSSSGPGVRPERTRANTSATPFQPHSAPGQPAQMPAPPNPPQPARPQQDGTKTGIHPHRMEAPPKGLPPRPGIDPEPAVLASASIIDEDAEGSDADFTLTDQTARVDLSGLNELEQQAGIRPRDSRDGD